MDPAEYIVDLKESFSGVWEQSVEDRFLAETSKIKEAGAAQSPYADAFERLETAESEYRECGADCSRCSRDIDVYADDVVAAEPEFWRQRLEQASSAVATTAVHAGVLHQWRRDLEAMLEQWKETYADEELAALYQRFKKQLEAIALVRQGSQGGEGLGFARGWDLSTAELMGCDAAALLEWLKKIEHDSELKRICDLIGRAVERDQEHEMRRIKIVRRETQVEQAVDRRAREEIDGLTFGRNIEDIVPSELVACADEDMEILFDLKFIEGRLLSFDKIGQVDVPRTREESAEVKSPISEACGPVIVCVDTSGSMSGKPEQIAKAVTLALALRAREEHRKCFLIQTSTHSLTMDLSEEDGLARITKFLSQSFGGGTDADQMIGSVIEAMARPGYERSDMLMVSDLIFGDRVKSFAAKMRKQQEQGSRFYALVVKDGSGWFTGFSRLFSNTLSDKGLERWSNYGFDRMWKYDAESRRISEMGGTIPIRVMDSNCPASGSFLAGSHAKSWINKSKFPWHGVC